MECYCYETDAEFIFCVENVENMRLEEVCFSEWVKNNGKYLLSYPQHEFTEPGEKELISGNFARLGQGMFESMLLDFDWEKSLKMLVPKFNESRIEWYIVGSVCDAVRGVNVKPKDMDIVVHTKDFYKAKEICYTNFRDSIVAPFSENNGRFAMPYFGRMFLGGLLVEIAANEDWNMENRQSKYEKTSWNGHDVYMESFQHRYQVEIDRDREDRIIAFEEYIKHG